VAEVHCALSFWNSERAQLRTGNDGRHENKKCAGSRAEQGKAGHETRCTRAIDGTPINGTRKLKCEMEHASGVETNDGTNDGMTAN